MPESGRCELDPMIHDANQIALYFAGSPREEAINGILDHIQKFWERPMKNRLIDYVARGGEGLHQLVIEAVKRLPIDA